MSRSEEHNCKLKIFYSFIQAKRQKKGSNLLNLGDKALDFCLKLLFGFTLRGEYVNESRVHGINAELCIELKKKEA